MPPQPTRPGRTADMMSEDCLYLGIATPAKTVNDKLPVMVWIHGGGFQTEWYGGDLWKHLALRGVVIVSIEYRTGALGFMAHPELTKESKDGHSGNYGLLDQIYALQWVQRNIAQFGGDPDQVTIFGESAGAISCSMLCASPLARGLFHRCISHSGGSFAPWSDAPRSLGLDASQKGAEQQGVAFMKHLKKKNLKQLRAMDAMALCDGNVGFAGFWPCVDGYVICDDQYRMYERGEYNDVPVIVMTNSDEGALFAPGNITAEDYQKTLKSIFGAWADEALKFYPGATNDEAWHHEANYETYRRRRVLAEQIMATLGCSFDQQQVGMFLWGRIPDHYANAEQLTERVLHEARVFITPGFIFGSRGERYIRISLCAKEEKIQEALERVLILRNQGKKE